MLRRYADDANSQPSGYRVPAVSTPTLDTTARIPRSTDIRMIR
jgi:hypothetical protein